ncbi:MAG: GAF domain-containing protein, partial [Anaerolineales bacterium]|nr:GAF domain-containing protein [Anaerolineales bacterium]
MREAAKAERLNAQVIINPEWVRQSLQETAVTLQPQQDPVATLRLASLVNSFNRSVSLTRDETDPTRQDFNKLRAYTAGQALLAEGKAVTAVSQQFQTAFGSDSNIQIGGQTLPSLGELTGQPTQPMLSASLGVAFAGDDITIIIDKGELLPVSSKPLSMTGSGEKLSLGLGYFVVQLYQIASEDTYKNRLLGEIIIDDESLYSNNIKLEMVASVNIDESVNLQISHESGFTKELSISLLDSVESTHPQPIDFSERIKQFTTGVPEGAHTRVMADVSNWLDTSNTHRVFIISGERGTGKTTIAARIIQVLFNNIEPSEIASSTIENTILLTLRRAQEYTNAPRAFIILDKNEHQDINLYQLLSTGRMHSRQIDEIPPGLIENSLKQSESILITTANTSTESFRWRIYPESQSGLAVPIKATNVTFGVLYLESPEPEGLTKEHRNFLERLASRLSLNLKQNNLVSEQSSDVSVNQQFSNQNYKLTSAFYFCQPSRPETLDPRSFALTIASQWASRDSNFAYLQSIIDNHEEYALDELVERLLIKPFTDIDELIAPRSIIFLVDDLEAALQFSGDTTIVDVILRMHRELYGVRFLLTAQMQTAVRDKLANIAAQIYELPPYFAPIFNFLPALNAMPTAVPGFTELLPAVDAWLTSPEAPQHGGVFPEQISGKSAAMANLIKYSQGLLPLPPELTTRLTAVQP